MSASHMFTVNTPLRKYAIEATPFMLTGLQSSAHHYGFEYDRQRCYGSVAPLASRVTSMETLSDNYNEASLAGRF